MRGSTRIDPKRIRDEGSMTFQFGSLSATPGFDFRIPQTYKAASVRCMEAAANRGNSFFGYIISGSIPALRASSACATRIAA